VEEDGVQYELRICPALGAKPRVSTPNIAPDGGNKLMETIAKDPFLPPFTSLYVGEIIDEAEAQEYVILLNKYAMVRGHFLMVSKDYQSQSAPLTPADLLQTYLLVLNATLTCGRPYFSFFNCGAKSGASQPHKHVQFLPILQGFGGPPIERVARSIKLDNESKPFTLTPVPFMTHVRRLNRQMTNYIPSTPEHLEHLRSELASAFMSLLDEMYHGFRLRAQREEEERPDAPRRTSESPSYNVIMTLEHMYIVPRAKEKFVADDGSEEAKLELSVNSLGFAGMLLVKSEDELERVRKITIRRILGEVGMKPLVGVEERGCDDVFLDDIH